VSDAGKRMKTAVTLESLLKMTLVSTSIVSDTPPLSLLSNDDSFCHHRSVTFFDVLSLEINLQFVGGYLTTAVPLHSTDSSNSAFKS